MSEEPTQTARPDLAQIESDYYRDMFAAQETKSASRPRLSAAPTDVAARATWRAAVALVEAAYHSRCAEIEETYAAALAAWRAAVGTG